MRLRRMLAGTAAAADDDVVFVVVIISFIVAHLHLLLVLFCFVLVRLLMCGSMIHALESYERRIFVLENELGVWHREGLLLLLWLWLRAAAVVPRTFLVVVVVVGGRRMRRIRSGSGRGGRGVPKVQGGREGGSLAMGHLDSGGGGQIIIIIIM